MAQEIGLAPSGIWWPISAAWVDDRYDFICDSMRCDGCTLLPSSELLRLPSSYLLSKSFTTTWFALARHETALPTLQGEFWVEYFRLETLSQVSGAYFLPLSPWESNIFCQFNTTAVKKDVQPEVGNHLKNSAPPIDHTSTPLFLLQMSVEF